MTDDDRQWLTALVKGLQTQIHSIETETRNLEARLLERIELTETRLLTAFHQ